MIFRELAVDDAPEVAAIESQLFAGEGPWSQAAVEQEIAAPHTFYIGAFDEESGKELLVGYAGLAMLGPKTDPEFEVHTIGVAEGYQGRGIGLALMDQLMHTADLLDGPVFLEVRTDNTAAIRLYESFGFFVLGTRRGYYQPSGADAYSMQRERQSQRGTT